MRTDANDMLYQFESSSDYNPQPNLEKIKASLYAVNSADDQVNPPELGILEREIKRVKHGRYIPDSDQRRNARPRHAFAPGSVAEISAGAAEGIRAAHGAKRRNWQFARAQ